MSKWVILDRDGVINVDSPDYIRTPDEWEAIPGSIQAIADLTEAGFSIAIITNQSGLDRGLFSAWELALIHAKMMREIDEAGGVITDIYICPHKPERMCECRKPNPGLYYKLALEHNFSLKDVPCIGNSLSDMRAAEAVSGKGLFVGDGVTDLAFTARVLIEDARRV